jgi:putative membrane protein
MFKHSLLALTLVGAIACNDGRTADREGGGATGTAPGAGTTPAERTGATPSTAEALSAEDSEFVQKATMGGQMEVTLGELANDKASDERVKALGEKIADDHERANSELRSMVRGADVARADRPMPEHDQTRQKLESLSGAAFDRAYLQEMVSHHEKDIKEFEKASNSSNHQVKAFAEKTLPTLRQHLEEAQQLQKTMGTRN